MDNKLFLGKVKVMGAGRQSGLEVKVTKVKEIKQYDYKLLFNWGNCMSGNVLFYLGFDINKLRANYQEECPKYRESLIEHSSETYYKNNEEFLRIKFFPEHLEYRFT